MVKHLAGKTRWNLRFRREIPSANGMLNRMSSNSSTPRLVVTVLGSGTSQGVPMIGCRCEVCRSTDPRDKRTRSSIFLATPEAKILVDTTPDLRQQALREDLDHVDAVLITHPHADHIMGFDDLRRFCQIQGTALPVYASAETMEDMKRFFHYAFNPKKVVPGYVHALPHLVKETFPLGGLELTPLPVPHGAISTYGFLFSRRGRKLLAYLSDCAAVFDPIREIIAGVEVLIIDGLRDAPHPTHLTTQGAVEVAQAVGAKRAFLTHLTHEKKYVDRILDLPEDVGLAYDGMKIEFDWD
jgi:phosphoribosyl 1,2-cyclic phosphate phosphodiesterase